MRLASYHSCIDWIGQKAGQLAQELRANMDVISNIACSVFLVGKLFAQVPSLVTRSAFLCVNITGLLYLDFQFALIAKAVGDTLFASCHLSTLLASTVKTVNAVSDFFLLVLGCVAAAAAFAGKTNTQMALYQVTRPWGVAFLVVSICLDVWRCFASTKALALLDKTNKYEIVQALSCKNVQVSSQSRKIAAQVRFVLDTYSWRKLQGELASFSSHRFSTSPLFAKLRKEVLTQSSFAGRTLALRGIGYVSLFISKACPDTLMQAIALSASSLLYTANSVYTRIKQNSTWNC